MKTCKLRVNYLDSLASLSVGQEVAFTSKVYQDKSWTSKYISDYPKTMEAASAAAAASPVTLVPKISIYHRCYKWESVEKLRAGFSVSVEVRIRVKAILVH